MMPKSYNDREVEAWIAKVKEIIFNGHLEGYKQLVNALFQYNVQEEMKTVDVLGIFIAVAGDGILPNTVKQVAEAYGQGDLPFHSIEHASHLPMVEKPDEFVAIEIKFLRTI